jgi:peroxiredoxin
MSLPIGSEAPDFTLADGNRQEVKLRSFRGQKNVVLAFYALAFTGGWTNELQGFQELLSEFEEADAQVLGVSIDAVPTQGAYAGSLNLTYPLLSDRPHYEACKAYDVFREDVAIAKRSAFVIDKQGIIRGVIKDRQDMLEYPRESLRILKEIEGKSETAT